MTETDAVVRIDAVRAVVIQIVRLISPERPARAYSGQDLIGELGFHSLALAELSFTLEDLFALDAVTPERAMSMRTVGDIVDLVQEALAAGAARLPDVDEVRAVCQRYGLDWDPEAGV